MHRNVNNADATRHAVNRVPFINSTKSRSGKWNEATGTYEVRSYATIVATYTRDSGQWWVTTDRYSVTTSRQVNALARSLDLVHPSPVLRCSAEDLVTA